MSLPNEWERHVYLGPGKGAVRLTIEQGLAFRELVMYTCDDRTVIANAYGDLDAKQLVDVINEGREALKKRRK